MGIGMALEETSYVLKTARRLIRTGRLHDGGERGRAADRRAFPRFPRQRDQRAWRPRIGEISLAGIAAAITAAVHHATGVRVRELPIKIEKLI